ncbi:hypothetical protein ABPG77_000425 [Micractinium sp. CCAP 211/92]
MPGPQTILQTGAAPAGTARSSVLTLINSAVGAGVLSFPFALRATGWAAGLACIALIAATEAFTLYVLSRFAEHTGARSYPALVHQMLGPAGSLVMIAVVFAYCFGSCIAYLIILGDSFRPLLLEACGDVWWTSRPAVIVGISSAVILPLSFKTHLGGLKAVSSLCLGGLFPVTAVVVVRSADIILSPQYSRGEVRAVNASLSFLTALPLVFFGFQCHTNVISVWEELEPCPRFFRAATLPTSPQHAAAEPGQLQPGATQVQAVERGAAALPGCGQRRLKSEKLLGMARVVVVAVALTGVFYSCVGLAGYLAFPTSAQSNIMLNFPADDPLIQVARGMIGLIQVAAYPVNHFPARGAVRDMVHLATGRNPAGAGFVAAETLAFYGATLGIALLCSDLGNIFKLVGGTCGSVLILAMPGCLLIAYARSNALAVTRQATLLQEPLLAAAPEACLAGAEDPAPGARPVVRSYRLWKSKQFYSGISLLVLSAALTVVTMTTTLHPLPPP